MVTALKKKKRSQILDMKKFWKHVSADDTSILIKTFFWFHRSAAYKNSIGFIDYVKVFLQYLYPLFVFRFLGFLLGSFFSFFAFVRLILSSFSFKIPYL